MLNLRTTWLHFSRCFLGTLNATGVCGDKCLFEGVRGLQLLMGGVESQANTYVNLSNAALKKIRQFKGNIHMDCTMCKKYVRNMAQTVGHKSIQIISSCLLAITLILITCDNEFIIWCSKLIIFLLGTNRILEFVTLKVICVIFVFDLLITFFLRIITTIFSFLRREIKLRQDAIQELLDKFQPLNSLKEFLEKTPDLEKSLCSIYHKKVIKLKQFIVDAQKVY